MKILAGIPTRCRDTSGKIADVFAEVCNEVVVISQGATVKTNSEKVKVIEKDINFGLVPARNAIFDYAVENNFDIILQSDDDLAFKTPVVEALIKEIVDNKALGAIASSSRSYFHWDEDLHTTKNFVLMPCAPQLWAMRMDVLKEIGYWTLPHLEDREHGCRIWRAGYAIGALHIDISLTHNPFIARNSNDKIGGQINNDEALDIAIKYMQDNYFDLLTIKRIQAKNRKFMTRYNWSNMLNFVRARFGESMGYSDTRGRML